MHRKYIGSLLLKVIELLPELVRLLILTASSHSKSRYHYQNEISGHASCGASVPDLRHH